MDLHPFGKIHKARDVFDKGDISTSYIARARILLNIAGIAPLLHFDCKGAGCNKIRTRKYSENET